MTPNLKVGDHVTWNSDVGHVAGTITKIHRADLVFLGKQRRASTTEPQYEVKSAKTGAMALHKASALNRSAG